jgi:predicted dehydrogenase
VSTIGSQPRPPIRIGVIGATPARGWGTAAHLPALQALGEFEVTAVATTRLTTARATAEVFGVPLAFADDAELVSSPAVDAVAIAVKVPEHDRLIRAALAAGKHVFSEWPLGVDLGQAVALADLARAGGVQHIVGLQGYHAPGALFVRELIENGDIGQLLTVSVVAAGGPAGRRIPQANVYATDAAAGATVLSISTGHILATLARAVGEFRQLSAVVALINKETTVIETGQTVPRLAASTSPTGPSPSASRTDRPRTCRCPGASARYPPRCPPGRRETSPRCTASSPGRSATVSRPCQTSPPPSGTTSCWRPSSELRTPGSARKPSARPP